MFARKTQSAKAASSFRGLSEERLREIFYRVRTYISSETGRFKNTGLSTPCSEIDVLRRTAKGYVGSRAFMHVGHIRNTVCSARPAAALSDSHLVGLFLHEFGHLAAGHNEPPANAWIMRNLGISISYKGPLDLQWVHPDVVRKILG